MSATLPGEVLEMTSKFMTDPLKVLVKRDELTLEVRSLSLSSSVSTSEHTRANTVPNGHLLNATLAAFAAPQILLVHMICMLLLGWCCGGGANEGLLGNTVKGKQG